MDYRASAEYRRLGNGERLRRRFEDAGFGNFFFAPGVHEWQILRKSKLLNLAAPPAGHLAVDTHMSLLADGDFVNQQEAIDAALLGRVAEGTDHMTAIRDGDVRRLGVVGVPSDEAVRSDHEDRAHDGNSSHLRLNRLPGEDRVEAESGP
jgi:hypothetical protein